MKTLRQMTVIAAIQAHVFNVSQKTNWVFISVRDSEGRTGWGEASLNGWEPMLVAATQHMASEWIGLSLSQAATGLHASPRLPGGLVANAVISAVAQGVASLQAVQHHSRPSDVLGPRVRDEVMLYANINRATKNRSPEGFVKTALHARSQGYSAFKAAPFDGLTPKTCSSEGGLQKIHHGVEVMAALRDALGPDVLLMVDCHWRFNEDEAIYALKQLRDINLHWFECPIAETHAHWPATRRIRATANAQGVLLAAAETQIGAESFKTLFDEKLYDVVMPDVKYCGGPWEMLRIAKLAADSGVHFAPHNPSGPICTWQSLQVASTAPTCMMLELQFDESDFYDTLQNSAHMQAQNGIMQVANELGLVLNLKTSQLEERPYQPVPPGMETILNR